MKIFSIIALLFFLLATHITTGQTQLQGNVTDEKTSEPILIGTVALYKDSILITGTDTDFDGNYFFSDIDPGIYDVEVSYEGYQRTRITDVIAKQNKITCIDIQLTEGKWTDEVCIKKYDVSLEEFNCSLTEDQRIGLPGMRHLAWIASSLDTQNIHNAKILETEPKTSLPHKNIASIVSSNDCIGSAMENRKYRRRAKRKEFFSRIIDVFRSKEY